jgi:hypothetical protein
MKGIRNTVWLFSLIVFSTTAWADQSLLNRCKRNGQRYQERAKKADAYARDKANHERIVRTLRNQDIGDGKIQGITFDGQPQFEAWAKDCVTAGWSEKIKDLPGYSEVLKYYEETKAIYSNLDNKYIPELYKKSQSAVGRERACKIQDHRSHCRFRGRGEGQTNSLQGVLWQGQRGPLAQWHDRLGSLGPDRLRRGSRGD